MTEVKHRFIDLDVFEVSLVDTPANNVEFAVTKRHGKEESKMPNEKATEEKTVVEEVAKTTDEQSNAQEPKAEKVEITIKVADNEKVQKELENVNKLLEGLNAKESEEKEVETEKSEEPKAEEEKSEEQPKEVEKVEKEDEDKACGMKKPQKSEEEKVEKKDESSEQVAALVEAVKSLTEIVQKQSENFDTVSKRVETIEKCREPKTSAEGHVTDKETTKSENIWAGLGLR